MVTKKAVSLFFLWLILIGAASAPRKFPTVDGPESTQLIEKTKGYILWAETVKGMTWIKEISLPKLEEKKITIPNVEIIHDVTGPDDEGRIAYFSDTKFMKSYVVALTTLSGQKHEVLFSEQGHYMDKFILGEPISLSPKGGRLALCKYKKDKFSDEALIQIWDVVDKRLVSEFSSAPSSFAWFPDGQRLAYVKLIDHRLIEGLDAYPESLQKAYSKIRFWPAVDCIFIYDLLSNEHFFLHTGFGPSVNSDGKSILLAQPGVVRFSNYYLLDLETGEIKLMDWPGRSSDVIAFTALNTILYKGRITTGREVKTVVNSPLWGRKFLPSVKLADLVTGEFQTVIDSVHPYDTISFGQVTHLSGEQ